MRIRIRVGVHSPRRGVVTFFYLAEEMRRLIQGGGYFIEEEGYEDDVNIPGNNIVQPAKQESWIRL